MVPLLKKDEYYNFINNDRPFEISVKRMFSESSVKLEFLAF